ncbi:MAG: cytochrome ubiquinol oxidase subunit I, partial [Dokdonella sp.]
NAYQRPEAYLDIELPANSAMGPVIAAIGFSLAFGLVWHIWWLVILTALAAIVAMIVRGFARNTGRIVSAQQVRQEHHRWLDAVEEATAISRADECTSLNAGLALQEAEGVVP